MEKISVIMPAYNSEKQIVKSKNSVLNQSHENFELIIINDGSSDDTEKVIQSFSKKDERIKCFSINNSGAGEARNIGLQNSTGDYIAFVDSDDYIEQNFLEIMYKKARKYNADIVSCSYKHVFKDKVINEKTHLKEGFYNKRKLEQKIYPYLFSNIYMNKEYIPTTMVTKLFKRTLIEENNIKFIPKLRMGEDLNFSRKCFLNADSFYYLPDLKFYKYIHNESSRTNTYLNNAWEILKEGDYQSLLISKKFPNYNLEKQIPYALVSSSMTAIANITKANKTFNRKAVIKELKQIVYDSDLQKALDIISTKNLNNERKILAKLIKLKRVNLIYIIVLFERIRKNNSSNNNQ